MDDSWEDLVSHWEMGDEDFFNDQNHKNSFDEEEFFRDIIIEQPAAFTPQSEATSTNNNISGSTFDDISLEVHGGGGGNMLKSSGSTNSIISSEKPSSSSSPTSYILCFDHNHSNNEPVCSKHYDPPLVSARKRPPNHESELLPEGNQRTKKGRDNCDREDHLMAERKRRQELTKRVIALSAIIPGLKKTDKAYILGEAVNYVKQLQERVRELENPNSKGRDDSSTILIKKTHCANEATPSCEKNIDGCNGGIEELPEVEARVLEKEVLIGIHCEKQKHSLRKILSLLSDLHLSIASTSVLPFGTSTVQITIISKMDEEYNMTMDDLVKTIRQHLLNLKSEDMQQ